MQNFRAWFLEQMGMYAAYHRDWRNRATHHLGVPLIVIALLLALMQVPVTQIAGNQEITAATVVLALLLLGYVIAIPLLGAFTALIYTALYVVAVRLVDDLGPLLWAAAGACFVVGLALQLVGHFFEGRRPALTVNAIQIFMAPPFLAAELIFALGIGSAFERQIQSRAVKYLPNKKEV